jgi:NAD(P)-dependent dehydrogenase (short-subunit alcohol dehydrogenase family)
VADLTDKVVLITGASSGIGYACAHYLSRRGCKVYGTSRQAPAPFQAPTADQPFTRLPMDVTRDDSVAQGVQTILDREGRIDAVVNNAGFGIAGAIEDTTAEEAKTQFETNFFGILRVCRAVLPHMRRQGGGTIVNISSIGGLIGLPFQGLYSASKFAVEGLSEALYKEVRPFGIRVVLVEPGDFRTAFTARRRPTTASRSVSAYRDSFQNALKVIESDETNGANPEQIARLVAKILRSRDPKLRYRAGYFTQKLAVTLKKFLPARLFDWIIMQHYQSG